MTVRPAGINVVVGVGDARMRVTYGPLPSPVDDPRAFASEVERRINHVHKQVQDAHDQLVDETRAREEAHRQARAELEDRIARVEGMSRSIAVGGLREQVYGWTCIAVGFILQVAATFMQAAAAGG